MDVKQYPGWREYVIVEGQNMNVEEPEDGCWWITNLPATPDCGPYNTKADAESDRKGLQRLFRHEHDRGFFTAD